MKPWLFIIPLVALVGCGKEPTKILSTDNDEFKVAQLFTIGDCTVYRFNDGRSIYFSDCRGSVSSQERYVCGHTGKNNTIPVYCYREHQVETIK